MHELVPCRHIPSYFLLHSKFFFVLFIYIWCTTVRLTTFQTIVGFDPWWILFVSSRVSHVAIDMGLAPGGCIIWLYKTRLFCIFMYNTYPPIINKSYSRTTFELYIIKHDEHIYYLVPSLNCLLLNMMNICLVHENVNFRVPFPISMPKSS